MTPFDDAAYTMAAVSATVALYRVLVKNGVLTRDEAVRALLDEAVSRAIQAEAQQHGDATTGDLNRQSPETLNFIAGKLYPRATGCPPPGRPARPAVHRGAGRSGGRASPDPRADPASARGARCCRARSPPPRR